MTILKRNYVFTVLLIALILVLVFQFNALQSKVRTNSRRDGKTTRSKNINQAVNEKIEEKRPKDLQDDLKSTGKGYKAVDLLGMDSSRWQYSKKAEVSRNKMTITPTVYNIHTVSTSESAEKHKEGDGTLTAITSTFQLVTSTTDPESPRDLERNDHNNNAKESIKVKPTSETRSAMKSTTHTLKPTEVKIPLENINIRRGFSESNNSYCNLSFNYGQMCPPSYVDLDGKCEVSGAGFDCPDIRNKTNNPHRQGQLVTTRMLRIFDFIAKKHNITYWLTGGTLLGAARHKGNIPWDTDNDIDIPLEEYIKFFQVGAKELPSDIFLQNSKSDPWLRPSDRKYAASISHPIVGIYQRTWNPRLRDQKSCYKYCIQYGCKWHDGMMIDMFVKVGNINEFLPLKQMEFEGFPFPVPNNWRELLSSSYGKDFMTVPKKESQRQPGDFPDVLHSCKELKNRA